MRKKVAVRTVNGIEMREMTPDSMQGTPTLQRPQHKDNLRKRTKSEEKEELAGYPPLVRDSIKDVKFIAEHLKKEDGDKSVSKL